MSLIRWKRNDFLPAASWLEDFFHDDFFKKGLQLGTSVPPVNVKETEHSYHLEVAVPGMKKEDFRISLDNGVMTIASEHKQEKEEKEGEKITRKEYNYSSFSRSFSLPDNASEEDISAEYTDGVLKISMAKTSADHVDRKKTIEIR